MSEESSDALPSVQLRWDCSRFKFSIAHYYEIRKVKRLHCRCRARFLWSLSKNSALEAFFALHSLLPICKDLRNIFCCVRHIRSVTFNVNVFSFEQSLIDFCFRPHEIGRVATLIGFNLKCAASCEYGCESETAKCIVICRLASCFCRYNLEFTFGPFCYILSEAFSLEALESSFKTILDTFFLRLAKT